MSESKSKKQSYNLEKLPPCSGSQHSKGSRKTSQDKVFIRVNSCKNPDCDNYNIPIEPSLKSKAFSSCGNDYKLNNQYTNEGQIRFQCLKCDSWATIFNNQAIYEEYLGIAGCFDKMSRANICRNSKCKNYYLEVKDHTDAFYKNGKTKTGLQKYKCKSCLTNFTEYDRISKTWGI